MKCALFFFLSILSTSVLSQVKVKGTIQNQKGEPLAYVTIAFQSTTLSSRLEGAYSSSEGSFEVDLIPDHYQVTIQMIGYENLVLEKEVVTEVDFGALMMIESAEELDEVVVRAERSYITNDLGKKTLYVGADLANAGSTAVDALESLPSVTTTIDGAVNVRGSENVIIYVNGRETKRDPKSLQFISADALKKIELITNPSAKYDAEGVAGIINMVYEKARTTKLELFGSITTPFRGSLGLNTSISSDRFSLYVTANERRSIFETSDKNRRITPEDSLTRYDNDNFSEGLGLTRELNAGFSYEPDTNFSIGFEINYLKWDDDADQDQQSTFGYENNSTSAIRLNNDWREIEDELSFTFSSEKQFINEGELKLQFTAGGEDEVNSANFNTRTLDLSGTPIEQTIRSSNETEDQRYYQGKLEYLLPVFDDFEIEAGVVFDKFNINVNQALTFFDDNPIDNRFRIEMDKYAGYVLVNDKRKKFEYSVGIRYEEFSSTSLQKATDSTFTQQFNNFFPSLQWKYPINTTQSLGFNFTRRINRPSFWQVSPFLSYTDPLNLETGNPYLKPEFGYLYELTYSGNVGLLSYDITGFRRTTKDVIQVVSTPFGEDRLLVSYDNLGIRHDDGVEWNASLDLSSKMTVDFNGNTYAINFTDNPQEAFFNRRWNWKMRLKQRFRLEKNWTLDLIQYYRSPSFGAQSIGLRQYYVNASIQKSFNKKRGSVTLSMRDIFNTRIFGEEVVGETFNLTNEYKYQTQAITFSLRYKLLD